MALFLKPFKRSGSFERCKISTHKSSTSEIFGIGSEHLVIEINMQDGKKGLIELEYKEAIEFISKISSLNFNSNIIQKAKNSWAELAYNKYSK
jgi:hypothetical protein